MQEVHFKKCVILKTDERFYMKIIFFYKLYFKIFFFLNRMFWKY